MSDFKPFHFKIEPAKEVAEQEFNISNADEGMQQSVQEYQFSKVQSSTQKNYNHVKKSMGVTAATDPDRVVRDGKVKFKLNPVMKDKLSIDDEERRQIQELINQRVDEVRETARSEGFEKGYAEGVSKASAENIVKLKQESESRIQLIESCIKALEQAKIDVLKANEVFIVETIYAIGRMILLKEISTDKEYVLRLANELIEKVGLNEFITLRISKSDVENLELLKEGIKKTLGSLQNVKIEVSDQLTSGGCIVETEWTAIDATLENQLKGMHAALSENRTAGEAQNG